MHQKLTKNEKTKEKIASILSHLFSKVHLLREVLVSERIFLDKLQATNQKLTTGYKHVRRNHLVLIVGC